MLTRKQRDLLLFVHERIQEAGVSPSFDEMREALFLKSKSGVHRLITALEERGFIRRLPRRARALEILKLPEELISSSRTPFGASALKRPQKAFSKFVPSLQNTSLPLYGKIAAGTPIEAISDLSSFVTVPEDLIGSGDRYALTVDGDSMVEAGILDGDIAVIRPASRANNGEIVVALIEGQEATLKTLYRKGAEILLEPANRNYDTQRYPAQSVEVQGVLVGLFRHYR